MKKVIKNRESGCELAIEISTMGLYTRHSMRDLLVMYDQKLMHAYHCPISIICKKKDAAKVAIEMHLEYGQMKEACSMNLTLSIGRAI